jgi:uncharacterized protein YciI
MPRPQFLILLRPARSSFPGDATADELAVVGAHFSYMKRAVDAGDAILVGRTQDERPLGLAVIEAADQASARRFMEADPAVAAGIFTAELRPYEIALLRAAPPTP